MTPLRPNNWNRIAEHYRRFMPEILAERKNEWAIDAYAWDDGRMIFMTPIEAWLWADIRNENMVMYPQVPVGRYFVDFGNPSAKVAIECDGAAYHTDVERDAARQADIEALGWTVYRFPGWLCATDFDEQKREISQAAQLIRAIGMRHGIKRDGGREDWQSMGCVLNRLMTEALDRGYV